MKEHITPEVGDVFKNGYGKKILVTKVWDYNNENSHADCIAENWNKNPFYLQVRHIPLKDFEFLTYIGRNETESNDLFKTENKE
jgi:hypothetical protein